jgi:hypothetical protein
MTDVKKPTWRTKAEQLTYNLDSDDPFQVIMAALKDALPLIPDIYGARVLVATAPSPTKRGSLWVPDKTLDEGRYQGKVGYVLGWGPNAFKYDPQFPSYPWEGPKPAVGDAVFYRTSDAWECGINGVSCRFILDDCIVGRVTDIEVIW